MANYHIGLDFGTSQTKVCLYNTNSGEREFVKFANRTFFLPSLVTRTRENKFIYGDEAAQGRKFRYFKMAAAEDEEMIQSIGVDEEQRESYRRYNKDNTIKPELLAILYLTYVFLYIKDLKSEKKTKQIGGGLLGKRTQTEAAENTFSIKVGIPTEWHNMNHLKRKVKFETILIAVAELAANFSSAEDFQNCDADQILSQASEINRNYAQAINKNKEQNRNFINNLLHKYRVSVFPESAAGITFLLATERLGGGYYAALDIGAGTSDFSIFEVARGKIRVYHCSESIGIASNDVYLDYNRLTDKGKSYEEIKAAEKEFRSSQNDNDHKIDSQTKIKEQIEKVVIKTFFNQHMKPIKENYDANVFDINRTIFDGRPILMYGGGANLDILSAGNYRYINDRKFNVQKISDFVSQVEIKNSQEEVLEHIELLILALGLSYLTGDKADDYIHNHKIEMEKVPEKDFYTYYDIQDAVYK